MVINTARPVQKKIQLNTLWFIHSGNVDYFALSRYCEKKSNKMVKVKVAIMVRMKPGSFVEHPEQIGASSRGQVVDDNFHNERLEWHTEERGAVMITGLLVSILQFG